jgi:outer membrane cobalamin receptor
LGKYIIHIILLIQVFVFNGIIPETKAQNLKDTLQLAEFEIKANYVLDNHGFKRVKLDSVILAPHLNADLSSILAGYSTIFIKSYGNGTLSTPSFRGTTAQHTQVEWNGINLNSPMLGQIDLSQVPVSQFDKVEILYGASGLSLTSGAFGGVVNLVTTPDWNNRLSIMAAQSIASFDNYTTNLNVVLGTPKFQSHTRFNYASGLNDFPYYNNYLGKEVFQPNASYKQYGLAQELFWHWNDHHLISIRLWYTMSNRNLPPIENVYKPDYHEKQDDNALRAVVAYKYIMPKYNLMIHSALSDQFMHYSSPIVDANHRVYTWSNRARFSYNGMRKLTIKPGFDFNYDWAISDSYSGLKTRSTTSFYAEGLYVITPKIQTSVVIREELIDGTFMPLIATIGFEYIPFRKSNFGITGNFLRNYRFPTLNELYWEVSGNPDLRPESDLGGEFGITYNLSNRTETIFLETTLSGYATWIKDMIVWTPTDGSLWKPENVNKVFARGIEAGFNISLNLWGFNFSAKNNWVYCRSTYEETASENDKKQGKQLIYIPVNTFNSLVSLSRWQFYLQYNFMYVGDRFTSPDNLTFMPAYNLSNIILGKSINLKDICLNLQIEIKNLFNLDYQSIASRPMPGINYAFTLKVMFNNNRPKD